MSVLLGRPSGLPLALTQAAAYIGQTAMSMVEYMEHYGSMWQYLVEQQDEYPLQEYAFCSVFHELEEMPRACEEAERGSQQPFTIWSFLYADDLWYELGTCTEELGEETVLPK